MDSVWYLLGEELYYGFKIQSKDYFYGKIDISVHFYPHKLSKNSRKCWVKITNFIFGKKKKKKTAKPQQMKTERKWEKWQKQSGAQNVSAQRFTT